MFKWNAKTGEIFVYDEIGPSEFFGMETGFVGVGNLTEAMEDIGNNPITLRINSPGGVVDEAMAMYNLLERHQPGVNVAIDSLAASSASFLALVGKRVTMAKNAVLMVHKPWSAAWGNASDLRKMADLLDTYEGRMMTIYESRLKITKEEFAAAMDAETWYTAEQALKVGLIDEIANYSVENKVELPKNRYKNTPEAFLRRDNVAASSNIKLRKFLTVK